MTVSPPSVVSVLLVEDNEIDAQIVLARLERFSDFCVHWVENLADCLGFLNSGKADAVLLDLNLPDASGADLIDAVLSACGTAPVIILTGTDDEAQGLQAMQRGCQDYLIKGRTDGQMIRRTILYGIERKAFEAASRLHAEVFQNASEGITVTDAHGTIISVNPAFCRITGYRPEEVIGKNPRILSSGRQDKDFYRSMWTTLRENGAWSGEIWNRTKSGEVYPEWLSISAVGGNVGLPTHYVGVFLDMTTMKRQEEALFRLAHHDALTGLPNRILLGDRMHQALAQTRRAGRTMAIAYVDLDGFMPVNDRYGHHIGDALLVEMSRRISAAVRAGDTVARLGGDEFVLVLQDLAGMEECDAALTRVLQAIAEPMRHPEAGEPIAITASIGVSLFPHDDVDPDTLIRHADQAMYIAKESGRNRYCLYDPEHGRRLVQRRENAQQLRNALDQGQFELFYQPKVNMRHGTVVGAEALIRWRHPVRGLVPPSDFLPLIEEADLEAAVGEWVTRTALKQMSLWRRQGHSIPVSVNIAASHLLRPDFSARMADMLAEFPDVPPRMLQIEVVETAALEDIGRARSTLEACRAMGVTGALDDFGTGYSSLTYLRHLPIDTLKIDQSFIRNLHDDEEDLAIVRGVIILAAGFGRAVLAEGIEKTEHGEMLLQLGCELGQGYRIARPMPSSDFLEWAGTWKPDVRWTTTRN